MFTKFIQIAILLLFIFIQTCFLVGQVNAQVNFKPEITVGNFVAGTNIAVSPSTETIGQYIKQIYQYAIGIVAILAVVVMMVGGVLWMTAGGNQTQISSAKSYISGSLLGLLLVMGSYVILKTINPDLVNFRAHTIPPVNLPSSNGTGCCRETVVTMGYNLCKDVKASSDCNTTMGSHVYMDGMTCSAVKGCQQFGAIGCCRDTTDMGGYYLCKDVKASSDCNTTMGSHVYMDGSACITIEGCRPYPGG